MRLEVEGEASRGFRAKECWRGLSLSERYGEPDWDGQDANLAKVE